MLHRNTNLNTLTQQFSGTTAKTTHLSFFFSEKKDLLSAPTACTWLKQRTVGPPVCCCFVVFSVSGSEHMYHLDGLGDHTESLASLPRSLHRSFSLSKMFWSEVSRVTESSLTVDCQKNERRHICHVMLLIPGYSLYRHDWHAHSLASHIWQNGNLERELDWWGETLFFFFFFFSPVPDMKHVFWQWLKVER